MRRMEYVPIKKKYVNNKKTAVFAAITLIVCLGISFASTYFMYSYRDERENTLNSGLITLGLDDNGENVTLDPAVPMSDDEGKQNTPYNFTLENRSTVPISAEVQLTINQETTISLTSVKYAIYIDDSEASSGTVASVVANSGILYEFETLAPNDPADVKVVFWIDYDYTQPESGIAEAFSATIKATGESINYLPE